jgi:hypothetical protein
VTNSDDHSTVPASHATDDRPTSAPSDNTTLVEVIAGYRDAGFDGDFYAEEGGIVRCGSCDSTIEADRIEMQSLRRLEGASDPADMAAVVALECPICGRRGTLVLTFGPSASAADQDVLGVLRDRRGGDLPGASAPGQAVDLARPSAD